MSIWYVFSSLGIFFVQPFWRNFSRFGMFHQETSGNPADDLFYLIYRRQSDRRVLDFSATLATLNQVSPTFSYQLILKLPPYTLPGFDLTTTPPGQLSLISFLRATTLHTPRRDSISRPIASVSLVASGDDTTIPHRHGQLSL
jgi:hypothetical protein